MRKIKFRVWDFERKRMFYEVDLFNHGWTDMYRGVSGIDLGWKEQNGREHDSSRGGEDKFVPEQFIGLYDSESEPIYEGDIIELDYEDRPAGFYRETKHVGVVEYLDECATFRLKVKDSQFKNGDLAPNQEEFDYSDYASFSPTNFWFTELDGEDCRVIGNIHENPELLEAGKK